MKVSIKEYQQQFKLQVKNQLNDITMHIHNNLQDQGLIFDSNGYDSISAFDYDFSKLQNDKIVTFTCNDFALFGNAFDHGILTLKCKYFPHTIIRIHGFGEGGYDWPTNKYHLDFEYDVTTDDLTISGTRLTSLSKYKTPIFYTDDHQRMIGLCNEPNQYSAADLMYAFMDRSSDHDVMKYIRYFNRMTGDDANIDTIREKIGLIDHDTPSAEIIDTDIFQYTIDLNLIDKIQPEMMRLKFDINYTDIAI